MADLSAHALARASQQMGILMEAKAHRSATDLKVSSHLLDEIALRTGARPMPSPGFVTGAQRNEAGDYTLQLDAEVTESLTAQLGAMGVRVLGTYPYFHSMTVSAPLNKIEAIANLTQVKHVKQPSGYDVGSIDEGDQAMYASSARTVFGFQGTGVKVGVLSDSCRYLPNLILGGQLPGVQILSGQSGIQSDGSDTGEGTAMMQLVHTISPGSSLAFATAGNSEDQFATNIMALALAGCKVITDDVQFYAEPVFQDGKVANAVNFAKAMGAQYYSSAGNDGSKFAGTSGTWEGDFTSSKQFKGMPALTYPGGSMMNQLTKQGKMLSLQWSDPFGASGNDYDLYVVDGAGNVISSSTDTQNGNDDPIEIMSCPASSYYVIVVKASGSNRFLHLATHRGRLNYNTAGAVSGHTCAAGAMSVAAAPATIYGFKDNQKTESFSSDGPRRMFFKNDGTPYTPGSYLHTGGVVRQKPDITAADGVTTSVPGFSKFYGTSAAAPNAAGVGALLQSYKSDLSPSQYEYYIVSTTLAPLDKSVGGNGTVDARAAGNYLIVNTSEVSFIGGSSVQSGSPINGVVALYKKLPWPFTFGGGTLGGSLVFPNIPMVVQAGNILGTFQATAKYGISGADSAFLTSVKSAAQRTPLAPFTITPLTISSVKVNPQPIPGGATGNLVVQLSAPVESTQTLQLSSENPAVVPVPATAKILPTQSSVSIPITPAIVNSPVAVNVTVKLGTLSLTTTVDVAVSKLSSITLTPTSVYGGQQSTATVRFDGKVATDTVVNVQASAPALLAVSQVTIPANSNFVGFTLNTAPTVLDQTSTVTATVGSAQVSADLKILGVKVKTIVPSRTKVFGGDLAQFTVTLDHVAGPAGVTVKLGTRTPGLITLPRSVAVPSGATFVTFFGQTNADYFATTGNPAVATVGGTAGGVSVLANLEVDPPQLVSLKFSVSSIKAGQTGQLTVNLGGKAPVGGVKVSLTPLPSAITLPILVTVPAGQSSLVVDFTANSVRTSTPVTVNARQKVTPTVNAIAQTSITVSP